MTNKRITIKILPLQVAVCRLNNTDSIPQWALTSNDFFSITRTIDELSIVCSESVVPVTIKAERGWRVLKVMGPLDFSLVGILSSLISPLAKNNISIFALSTYDTDYVLIKKESFEKALEILDNFHTILY